MSGLTEDLRSYGVVAYSVSQERREIGIRMAVGARGTTVVRQVFGRGMGPVVEGIVCGLGGATALARPMTRKPTSRPLDTALDHASQRPC